MRKYLILTALIIFWSGMSLVFVSSLNPLDTGQIDLLIQSEDIDSKAELSDNIQELVDDGLILEYINVRNVLLVFIAVIQVILFSTALIHMVIERLLVRKFYEGVSLLTALRRGSLIATIFGGLFWLKLIATEWYVQVAYALFLLILELIITIMMMRWKKDIESTPEVEIEEDQIPLYEKARLKLISPIKKLKGRYIETRARMRGN